MVETMTFDGDALHLLDQRALPAEVRYLVCRTAAETAQAIRTMVVRGAPAIGVTAAYGLAAQSCRSQASSPAGDFTKTKLSVSHTTSPESLTSPPCPKQTAHFDITNPPHC